MRPLAVPATAILGQNQDPEGPGRREVTRAVPSIPHSRRFQALEFLLRREALSLGLVLLIVTGLCWLWIAVLARDMYGAMSGPAAWMMTSTWDATHLLLLWAMWAVMMAGMMLPAAAPTLLLHVGAARARGPGTGAGARVHALAGGYLLVWAVFSVGATLLQRLLASGGLLSSMMEPASPALGAALLAVAGLYQLTPLKHACLRACRSPLALLAGRPQPGSRGAFRLGITHGVYCLGCCWALMLLLFAGGVMNLAVIAALTGWVLVEKLLPFGERSARVSGVLLIATAGWMLLR
jgi:predicted metal-binding membrane protein